MKCYWPWWNSTNLDEVLLTLMKFYWPWWRYTETLMKLYWDLDEVILTLMQFYWPWWSYTDLDEVILTLMKLYWPWWILLSLVEFFWPWWSSTDLGGVLLTLMKYSTEERSEERIRCSCRTGNHDDSAGSWRITSSSKQQHTTCICHKHLFVSLNIGKHNISINVMNIHSFKYVKDIPYK